MRITRLVLALTVAGSAFAPAHAACDGTPLSSTRATVDVDGLTRTFIVRAPADYDGRTGAPVVLAFHPFGMNADYMASRAPIGRAWPAAIAIFPNGSPRPGAGFTFAWQGSAGELGDRDLRFFDAMLAWIRGRACVDERRIFALGYSNGAQFAYLLACERGSVIAALAIASGRMGCQPARPLPVIINHGTRDATIPLQQALAASSAWTRVNGCRAPPAMNVGACSAAASCASAPLTLCTYAGGHEYDDGFTAAAANFFKSAVR